MHLRVLIPAILIAVAACETVPPTMDPLAFSAEVQRLQDNPSPASADQQLTALLARTDLTPEQRADALYLRAEKRLSSRFDLPGAVADLDQFLALSLEDARSSTATRHKVFAATEIEQAQRRLAQLQNLPDWFDDKVLMGDLAAGAARYRESGLTPSDAHLYMLREGGFVCDGGGETEAEVAAEPEPVHRHGDEPDYVAGAVWCIDPSLS